MYQPKDIEQFTTPIGVQHRTSTSVNGAPKVSFSTPIIAFGNWKNKGGKDDISNGSLIVIDTGIVTMWYDPTVTQHDRFLLDNDPKLIYEVINIDDIDNRHMIMNVKVKNVSTS